MMRMSIRKSTVALVPLGALALMAGCATHPQTVTTVPAATVPVTTAPTTTVIVPSASANPQRVVYSEGVYELRGDGSTTYPYYWVWIPRGTTVQTIPPPPPLPVR